MSDFDYKVTVKVFDQERYDGEWIPENLPGAIAWLQAKLEEIPPEYRDDATIEIGSIGSWENSHYATVLIEYTRPPTDDEIAERKLAARERAEEQVAIARQRLMAEEQRLAAAMQRAER